MEYEDFEGVAVKSEIEQNPKGRRMRSARVQGHFQTMDVSPQQKARQPVRECTRTLNHGCGSSSNGSCRDDLALGARSDASTQQITGPPLRLRGRPLLMAAIRHDLVIHVHTTAASGPSRSLEQLLVLCLFSSMDDRSGSAIPSTGTPYFRR